ncbi:MAG TPA: bifunctional ADP-heptose synthase [Candidatus Hydrothermia bacterium]|nr:bifunctional ADP-heptose synthase [Candidatus Hydrothermia bacterium]HOL23657.1 bifunctional ADP-heptose synthase [Candidatus Hydrothermia bacterium]HPO78662.1 bifunctional ADP-heptose synthase [Candidatus Hydrothermia bacterium]
MGKMFEAIDHFKKLKGIVIGDLMLDVYSFGSVDRISPEAPVPIIRVENEEYRPGGAGNVACNLRAFGSDVLLLGIVGHDNGGDKLLELLEREGVKTDHVVQCKNRTTIVKNRIVAKGQQLLRVDREATDASAGRYRSIILEYFDEFQDSYDFVIIEDYNKGLLNGFLYRELISRSRIPVFIDPKFEYFSAMKGAFLLKPNFEEFRRAMGVKKIRNNIARYLESMRRKLNLGNLVVTMGSEGMFIINEEHRWHIPSLHRNVFDVTGAGDMVISILSLGITSGLNLFESAVLATIGAGIEISKLGAQPICPEELTKEVESSWRRLLEEARPLKVQA